MIDDDPVLVRMKGLLDNWEADNDRRLIFLSCYQMMTQNILTAIEMNEFEDNAWVNRLMENFAGYYFTALEVFEKNQGNPPAAWRIAFNATQNQHTNVLQNLVLGVNAHINYDLVLALSDILAPEWPELTADGRQMRYRDHCHVNEVIYRTINAVQDQVIDRYEPLFGFVDKFLGPVDEWMTSLLISDWREEVWKHATLMIEPAETMERQVVLQLVERVSIERAKEILGRGNLTDLIDFL